MNEPMPAFDLATWLKDLDEKLAIAGQGYLARKSDELEPELMAETWPPVRSNRTSFAMLALGILDKALTQLPGMQGHVGLVPLHDLMAALIDLGQGGKPSLLQPVPGVGIGNEQTADRWVRQHALLFVALLEAIGVKGGRACETVAAILAGNGHVGRKRNSATGTLGPLSPRTVAHWRSEYRKREFAQRDPRMTQFIERNLNHFRTQANWPLSEADLTAVIASMAASDLLKSKI